MFWNVYRFERNSSEMMVIFQNYHSVRHEAFSCKRINSHDWPSEVIYANGMATFLPNLEWISQIVKELFKIKWRVALAVELSIYACMLAHDKHTTYFSMPCKLKLAVTRQPVKGGLSPLPAKGCIPQLYCHLTDRLLFSWVIPKEGHCCSFNKILNKVLSISEKTKTHHIN